MQRPVPPVWAMPLLAALTGACGESRPPVSPTGPDLPGGEAVQSAVAQAYLREFGEDVPRPALFNDPAAATCPGQSYLMTVAHLPSATPEVRRLFAMYMSRDGMALVAGRDGRQKYSGFSVAPAGTFRALSVILTYSNVDYVVPWWEGAEQRINAQHASFAQSRGFTGPIVQFVHTNVLLPGSEIAQPRALEGVRGALAARGVSVSGFDFVAVINIDPSRSEGGFAAVGGSPPYFVYMGNFGPYTELAPNNVDAIASATFHHEVGHHWGWEHDWTPTCGSGAPFAPFITAPALFGWEDTDGDSIPEILDPTPYGRSR